METRQVSERLSIGRRRWIGTTTLLGAFALAVTSCGSSPTKAAQSPVGHKIDPTATTTIPQITSSSVVINGQSVAVPTEEGSKPIGQAVATGQQIILGTHRRAAGPTVCRIVHSGGVDQSDKRADHAHGESRGSWPAIHCSRPFLLLDAECARLQLLSLEWGKRCRQRRGVHPMNRSAKRHSGMRSNSILGARPRRGDSSTHCLLRW